MAHRAEDQNLKDSVDILSNLHISFWLNEGTLLGLVRDGQLIEWDHDIDISIFASELSLMSLVAVFESQGFHAKFAPLRRPGHPPLKLTRAGGRVVDIGIYDRMQIGQHEYWAHLWFSTDKVPPKSLMGKATVLGLRLAHRAGFRLSFSRRNLGGQSRKLGKTLLRLHTLLSRLTGFNDTVGYFIRGDHLTELTSFDFFGTSCPIPRQAEKVLTGLYGDDWKVPKKSQRWTDYLSSAPSE